MEEDLNVHIIDGLVTGIQNNKRKQKNNGERIEG